MNAGHGTGGKKEVEGSGGTDGKWESVEGRRGQGLDIWVGELRRREYFSYNNYYVLYIFYQYGRGVRIYEKEKIVRRGIDTETIDL